MKHRKSPFRHPVRAHERGGIQVNHYVRGEGGKPVEPRVQRPARKLDGHGFDVTFYYDGGSEDHKVGGNTFTEAIQQGVNVLEAPTPPHRAYIRRLK